MGAVESVPSDLTKDIEKDPKIKIYYAPGDKAAYILINWKTAKDPKTGDPNPFLNVRVRRALNHALDIEALIKNYMTGYEKRTTLLGQKAIGYNPDVPFYEYNPEKARQLMAEAGYAQGIKTQYFAWAGVTPIVEATQKYWQEIGIQVEVKRSTRSVVWRDLMMKKDQRLYGLTHWGKAGGPDPGNWFKSSVLYKGVFAIHGQNDRVDEIARQQAREFDQKKRAALIDEAIQIIWKDAWFIPLWQGVAIKAVRTEWSYQDPPFTTGIVITNISKKK